MRRVSLWKEMTCFESWSWLLPRLDLEIGISLY
jgi:hypothetical protein